MSDAEQEMLDKILDIAKTKTESDDPLVHIVWTIEGISVFDRTNGKRGNSVEDCKRYVVSQILADRAEYRHKLLAEIEGKEAIPCAYCGAPVLPTISKKMYCNHSHRQLAYKRRAAGLTPSKEK